MEKEYINHEHLELMRVYRKEGIYKTEDGREFKYKNYYAEIRNTNTGLILVAKIDKVFKDYVEDEEE